MCTEGMILTKCFMSVKERIEELTVKPEEINIGAI